MVKSITLNSKEDVIRLNQVACSKEYNVGISCGYTTLDAKSLLALFNLIGKSGIKLVLPDHCREDEMFRILKQMKLA